MKTDDVSPNAHQTVNNEQTNPMHTTIADDVTSPTVTSPPAEYTEIASPSQTEKVGLPQKSFLGMRPRMVFPLTLRLLWRDLALYLQSISAFFPPICKKGMAQLINTFTQLEINLQKLLYYSTNNGSPSWIFLEMFRSEGCPKI